MVSVNTDIQAEEPLLLIGVMGVTGSGKSTFVQKATGKSEAVIGHTLEACTQEVTPYHFQAGGYNVVLVDTPGFNDTYKSDTEILIDLATWLEATYRQNMRLNGIIYLHRITDVRMDGGSMRNLRMFRKLCGPDPMMNVIIASTFWGVIPEERAIAHETELKDKSDFWGDMIEHGARVERFLGDRKSALDIIMELAGKPTVVLELQQELVDEAKPIHETSAGAAVNEELQKMERKYTTELKKLQEETAEALADKDVQLQAILEKERERMERRLEKVRDDQELLRQERREEIRQIEAEHQSRYSHVQSQYERMYEKQKAVAEIQRTEDRQAFREQMSEMHLKNAALEAQLLEKFASSRKQKAGHDDGHRRALQEQTGADGSSREDSKVLSDDMQQDDSKGIAPEKSNRREKMLEVGSALLSIAASGAMCAVNPVAAVGVVGGVIDLLNIIGRRSSNRAGRQAAEQSDTYTSSGET